MSQLLFFFFFCVALDKTESIASIDNSRYHRPYIHIRVYRTNWPGCIFFCACFEPDRFSIQISCLAEHALNTASTRRVEYDPSVFPCSTARYSLVSRLALSGIKKKCHFSSATFRRRASSRVFGKHVAVVVFIFLSRGRVGGKLR